MTRVAGAARVAERLAVYDGAARPATSSARLGPTPAQYAMAAAVVAALAAALRSAPLALAGAFHAVFFVIFGAALLWRVLLIDAGLRRRRPAAPELCDADLPAYTVIAPLFGEARMVAPLLAALEALDYPRDRLQVLLALEADDGETRAAARAALARSPLDASVVLSPAEGPRTKPKACNAALSAARGAHVVVFDAEDRPDPAQLREAAARFAQGAPGRRGPLGCLQAPLRVLPGRGWIQRQFALEYAALFETQLPGCAALGLPLPLGGTSNHFDVRALRAAGGWDAWNVTEDADIGFRLAALGWSLDVLSAPTWESAPPSLAVWTPQRTRWIKGYMQTWGVHMRAPGAGGWRRAAALQLTLGLAIVSSVVHGALALGVVACLLVAAPDGRPPALAPADLALLVGGWAAAVAALAEGERVRGGALRLADALTAPFYWPLQSLAAVFAGWQLVVRPFHWDKTPHAPEDAHVPGAV